MAWGRMDDGLHKSVKWRRASRSARGLWATAHSWCGDELTDGFVPTDMLGYLDGTKADARSLVDCGLWDVEPGGWRFHAWTEYNPSRAEVEHKREQQRERRRRWAERQNASRDAEEPVPDEPVTRYSRVTHASGNATPDPTRPDPTPTTSQSPDLGGSPKRRASEHPEQECGRRHDPADPCGACGAARRRTAQDDLEAQRAKSRRERDAHKADRAKRQAEADATAAEAQSDPEATEAAKQRARDAVRSARG